VCVCVCVCVLCLKAKVGIVNSPEDPVTFDVVRQVCVCVCVCIDDVSSEVVVGQTERVSELLFFGAFACFATQTFDYIKQSRRFASGDIEGV